MKIEQINSIYTISKTNIFARENGCLEDYSFSKGTVYPDVTPTHSMSIFTCAVFNTPAQQHSTNHHPLDNDQTESPHCASVPNKILHSWRRPTKPVVARDTPPPPKLNMFAPESYQNPIGSRIVFQPWTSWKSTSRGFSHHGGIPLNSHHVGKGGGLPRQRFGSANPPPIFQLFGGVWGDSRWKTCARNVHY